VGDISNEPSMEDILASIKRIIADDPSGQTDVNGAEEFRAMAKVQTDTMVTEHSDVLHLAADQFADEATEPAAPVLDEQKTVVPLLAEKRPSNVEPMLSKASADASRVSLANLSKMIVRQDDEASNTLEGLVRDLLKPMIKPWLDDNLPAIVERAVAQEVARLTGRDL
jgi:uncharacterized protein